MCLRLQNHDKYHTVSAPKKLHYSDRNWEQKLNGVSELDSHSQI